MMRNLFDIIDASGPPQPVANDTWRPGELPSLSGINKIYLNFETTGLRWFEDDRPISMSLRAGGRSHYIPWGHRGGGNLQEEQVRRWANAEIRGKHIVNINTRFDVHMGRVWGVDFEGLGNTVSDVAHYAALLDDHRFQSSLDYLIPEFLGEQPMQRLDESRMASYSAGAAAPRSMYNVEAVERLEAAMWPMLDAQNLQKVRQLEDQVIYVVCEMEKNGTLLDQELLEKWIKETTSRYHRALMDLAKEAGFKVNPNSAPDQAKLFAKLGIKNEERTKTGGQSFTEDVLKHIPHPTVQMLRRAKKYGSLNSKLKKYGKSVDSKGILRYALHQMRASKSDAENSEETGTVVGRFTSTEIVDGVGINIQQVLKPEKQFHKFGDEFFVRELHIPASGYHLAADAEQIQYRIFAHEANNPKVNAEYEKNPHLSFHKMTWALFRAKKPDLTYGRTKDVNFAKIFAAGPSKLGLMLEFITKKQFEELKAMKANRNHPWLAQVKEILDIYKREIPEADDLAKEATELAETRGYVTSILGRRMRFIDGERSHKALNGRIIMSEADIVKEKAVELHRNRKYTQLLLRFQVHDEFDGDIPDAEHAKRVNEVLNHQSFKLRIPILWKTTIGTSWGDCAKAELAEMRAQKAEDDRIKAESARRAEA